jgi:hypothetical protein
MGCMLVNEETGGALGAAYRSPKMDVGFALVSSFPPSQVLNHETRRCGHMMTYKYQIFVGVNPKRRRAWR